MLANYFNYFTEIEDRFQRRRGSAALLSTLDWALIETWKDAGIPLDAVLRGIDAAFDTYDRKPGRAKVRKVNSLAYCSQEVLSAVDDMKEAAAGTQRMGETEPAGISTSDIAAYLERNAALLEQAKLPVAAQPVTSETGKVLRELAACIRVGTILKLEDLERHLTVLEEKLMAALLAATPDKELLAVRTEADRDIAPYRSKMIGAQIEQLHRQYVNKRLLERARLPRLSLFYL